ncbi:MAG: hypothetical protein KAR47_02090 [Planctomycetes bacterium]|nr:hypothetical protein [Planctomycetota bacterium]
MKAERGIGSVEDWQSIVEEYGSRVWRTAYRLLGNDADASDCFQETFLSAYTVCMIRELRIGQVCLQRKTDLRGVRN